jgi:hypothetical protein
MNCPRQRNSSQNHAIRLSKSRCRSSTGCPVSVSGTGRSGPERHAGFLPVRRACQDARADDTAAGNCLVPLSRRGVGPGSRPNSAADPSAVGSPHYSDTALRLHGRRNDAAHCRRTAHAHRRSDDAGLHIADLNGVACNNITGRGHRLDTERLHAQSGETDYSSRISKIGDAAVRTAL